MQEDYCENSRTLVAGIAVSACVGLAGAAGEGVGGSYLLLCLSGLYAPLEARLSRGALRMLSAVGTFIVPAQWMLGIAVIPRLAAGAPRGAAASAACAYVFGLALFRSLFHDIRTIHGDTISGRETIPTLIGIRRAKLLIIMSMAALCLILFIAPLPFGLACSLTAPLVYIAVYLDLYRRRCIVRGVWCDCIADAQFMLAGAAALLWHWYGGR
ncbi:MAG: hypothetical protein NT045_05470 [Candidatus Aureabacteria bacterium]|nr:hypothetical protein [Candidatus Auribacterota bacterium]